MTDDGHDPRRLLACVAEMLAAPDVEAVAHAGVGLLAAPIEARVVALFLATGGDLGTEAWWPADETMRARHRPFLRGLALESLARGGAVVMPAPPELGPARVRVERLVDGGRTLGVLCALCPATAAGDEPAFTSALALVVRVMAQRGELAALHHERTRQERWFRQLDQHIRVLDRERQKFAAIVNQSDTFVFTADVGRVVRWTNRSLATALAPAEGPSWAGQSCDALWSRFERSEEGWRCPVAEALQTERPARADLVRRVGNTTQPLWATALPIRGPEGRTHEVLVLVQNLAQVGALRRAEARVHAVLAYAPIILFAIDRTGRVTLSLGRALSGLGFQPGELVGRMVSDIYPDRPDLLDDIRRALAGESFTSRIVIGPTALETHFVPMRDAAGALDGAIGVSLDISERLRLETELRHAHEMEAAAYLAGAVAHEFNDLLTVIMGNAELIRGRLHPDHPLRPRAEELQRAGQQGALLTRRLLTLGRAGEGDPQPLPVRALLDETADMLRGLLGARIELAVTVRESTEGALVVRADRARLEQALASIVLGARDAMPRGGRLTLAGEAGREGGVVIAVTHAATSASEVGADSAGLEDGRAMLTLVRAAVSRFGGSVEVEGGGGSGGVRLWLPAGESPAAEAA